ncbi:3,2-trans-enoyl-CoA isomerase [mine drainage metagenome]|uniref:3,2-trans-enoyl-CoA isomerase n=1 Tax=mine drainage metagenome TaxID=410659 RepID=T1CFS3_9ZZZZ
MLHITEHAHGIRELRLARPPVNALDADLIRALRKAIEAAPAEGAQALLISGSPGMFSAGLDVPALLMLDAPALQRCFEDFFGMAAALAQCPIPVAAAVTGHSPAGGAVIALFCDYRVMAQGPFKIGLNEVQVGLTVPVVIRDALARLLGPYRAERLLVSGAMLESDGAAASGHAGNPRRESRRSDRHDPARTPAHRPIRRGVATRRNPGHAARAGGQTQGRQARLMRAAGAL